MRLSYQKTEYYSSGQHGISVFVCFQNILPFSISKLFQEYNFLT